MSYWCSTTYCVIISYIPCQQLKCLICVIACVFHIQAKNDRLPRVMAIFNFLRYVNLFKLCTWFRFRNKVHPSWWRTDCGPDWTLGDLQLKRGVGGIFSFLDPFLFQVQCWFSPVLTLLPSFKNLFRIMMLHKCKYSTN